MDPIAGMIGALVAAVLGFFGGQRSGRGVGLAEGRREALHVALHQSMDAPPPQKADRPDFVRAPSRLPFSDQSE